MPQQFRPVYWYFALLLLVEMAQALTKWIDASYYFHAAMLGLFALGVAWLGWLAKVNRWLVGLLSLLGVVLAVLMFFVVWN